MVCLCAQSCLILCDPVDCSPPGSSVHGISQARILEWVAISSSRGSSQHGLNSCLLYLLQWHTNSLPLHHLGSPHRWRRPCFPLPPWAPALRTCADHRSWRSLNCLWGCASTILIGSILLLLLLSRFSRVRLCATPWTAAHQAPPSMGFSRQEDWSGCHLLLRGSILESPYQRVTWPFLSVLTFCSIDQLRDFVCALWESVSPSPVEVL